MKILAPLLSLGALALLPSLAFAAGTTAPSAANPAGGRHWVDANKPFSHLRTVVGTTGDSGLKVLVSGRFVRLSGQPTGVNKSYPAMYPDVELQVNKHPGASVDARTPLPGGRYAVGKVGMTMVYPNMTKHQIADNLAKQGFGKVVHVMPRTGDVILDTKAPAKK